MVAFRREKDAGVGGAEGKGEDDEEAEAAEEVNGVMAAVVVVVGCAVEANSSATELTTSAVCARVLDGWAAGAAEGGGFGGAS